MAGVSLINGKAYSHTQIVLAIGGVPIAGLESIDYEATQEKTNNYGAGTEPVSRGHGPKEYGGAIGLHMEDVEAIRASIPSGSLLDIEPFDLTVTFLNTNKVITHVLKNCEFTSDKVSSSQGDTKLTETYDLVIGKVKFR